MGLFKKNKKTVTVSENNKYLGFTPDELTVIEAFLKKSKDELIDDLYMARDCTESDMNPVIDSAINKLKKMDKEVYNDIEVMILG